MSWLNLSHRLRESSHAVIADVTQVEIPFELLSCIEFFMSHIKLHVSLVTDHTSHMTRHTSHITLHTSRSPVWGSGTNLALQVADLADCLFFVCYVQSRYQIQAVVALTICLCSARFFVILIDAFIILLFLFCREVKKARVVSLSQQRRVCLQRNDNRQSEFDNKVRTGSHVTRQMSHVTLVKSMIVFQDI